MKQPSKTIALSKTVEADPETIFAAETHGLDCISVISSHISRACLACVSSSLTAWLEEGHLLGSTQPAWFAAEVALDLVWELSTHAPENSFNLHCGNPHFIHRKVFHRTTAVYRATNCLGLPRTQVSWGVS